MTELAPLTPFRPEPPEGFLRAPMPTSVPDGLRLELSRAPIIAGRKGEFEEWMTALGDRYEEHEAALSNERTVFEATFRHDEADGTTWMYRLSLIGVDGDGLDESLQMGADHARTLRDNSSAQ